MIQVVYKNGKEDVVDQKFLDILLYLGEVQEFRRSDHWVNVTEDPIRSFHRQEFSGRDRRRHAPTEFISVPVSG